MGNESNELAQLRARVGRLEMMAWVERAVLAYALYLLWDQVDNGAVIVGATVLLFFVFFSIVERVRALR